MRLAQAARNLSITTDDIVTFLAKKDIEIERDSNTKLDENSIHLLFKYFDADIPVKKSELNDTELISEKKDIEIENSYTDLDNTTVESTEEETLNIQDIEAEIDHTKIDDVETEVNESIMENEDIAETEEQKEQSFVKEGENSDAPLGTSQKYKTVADLLEDESNIDDDVVIKAAKVSLQGLNVLGKIDLPEPKSKQEKEESPKRIKKDNSKNRSPKRAVSRSSRKELTPQQLREREKKKEIRKKEEEERRAKKKREEFYKEQILKPKQEQQKKKKPKQKLKKSAHSVENKSTVKPLPKSILGKFWRWLNT